MGDRKLNKVYKEIKKQMRGKVSGWVGDKAQRRRHEISKKYKGKPAEIESQMENMMVRDI